MKKYLLFAATLLGLASCTSEDFVGDEDLRIANENTAISFGFDVPATTRAGGADAASALGNRFIVYGEKGAITNAAPAASGNLVFPNYQVNWATSTANTTTSNTKDWEYVGYTHSANYQSNITTKASSDATAVNASDAVQTIKYWDYSAANYVFTAVSALDADIEAGRVKIQKNEYGSTVYDKGYTITLAKSGSDIYPSLNNLYFSDREVIAQGSGADRNAKDAYGGYVELTFRNVLSHVRAGVYETIPGYDIIAMEFYVSDGDDTGDDLDKTTDKAFGAICPNTKIANFEGSLNVVYYSDTDGALENQPKVTVASGASPSADLILGTNFSSLATSSLLGKTSNAPTWDTSGGTFTDVLPQIENSNNLKLTVDYTLWNNVTGETIEVKGATAEVPAAYLQWKPSYKYTYLFKISYDNNGSSGQGVKGLYPITFDALTVEAENGDVEYITTVSEPSITTYSKASDLTPYDEYKTNNNIYVAVEDNHTNPTLTVNTNAKLYFVTIEAGAAQSITEANVANAIANGTQDPTGTWTVTDALGKSLVVTDISSTLPLTGDQSTIPASDSPSGVNLSINCAKFKPVPTYEQVTSGTALTPGTKYYTSVDGDGEFTAGDSDTADASTYRMTASGAGYYAFEYTTAVVPATYTAATGTYVAGTTYYTDNTGATEVDTTSFIAGTTDVSSYYVVGTPAKPAAKYYKVIKVVE